jgi:hypothetical protein
LILAHDKKEGPDNGYSLQALESLEKMDDERGRWNDALSLVKHVYEARSKKLGENDDSTLSVAMRYSLILQRLGQKDAGLKLLERSTTIARTGLTTDESSIRSEILLALIDAQIGAGLKTQARSSLQELESVAQTAGHFDSETPANLKLARALLLRAEGDSAGSRTALNEAKAALDAIDSPNKIPTLKQLLKLLDVAPDGIT